jgi:hypothetical protein
MWRPGQRCVYIQVRTTVDVWNFMKLKYLLLMTSWCEDRDTALCVHIISNQRFLLVTSTLQLQVRTEFVESTGMHNIVRQLQVLVRPDLLTWAVPLGALKLLACVSLGVKSVTSARGLLNGHVTDKRHVQSRFIAMVRCTQPIVELVQRSLESSATSLF